MNFWYEKIVLWMKNGKVRTLEFKNNKVNIVTGGCETGKSTILGIIDYCFFASGSHDSGVIKIPQAVINENVEWYGVKFHINESTYTIARKSLISENQPNEEYYFSSEGEVPEKINTNASEKEIKLIINKEFGITKDVVIPYGGKKLKAGNKISPRYFMLFNSQDENTIINSDVFFDRQSNVKYQEALHRIFDIAIGISMPEDILIKEKITQLEKELAKYEKKQEISMNAKTLFTKEIDNIICKAKSYGIIPEDCNGNDAIIALNSYIESGHFNHTLTDETLDELQNNEDILKYQISNINRFLKSYKNYSDTLKKTKDSLLPIEMIKDYLPTDNKNSVANKIISGLTDELTSIKVAISKENSNDYLLRDKLENLVIQLDKIREKKKLYDSNKNVTTKELYMFLGEIRTQLKLFTDSTAPIDYTNQIDEYSDDLEKLRKKAVDKSEHGRAVIKLLEDTIKELLDSVKDAMETYKDYLPTFNYSQKKLELQKPGTTELVKFAGSSSNTLFLHLCLMLGLHDVAINNKVPYIPSYLILDQPSRPYYDNSNNILNDRDRIIVAIKLLNDYIDRIQKKYNTDFQIIVVEHIRPDVWENMNNINLVADFTSSNKLIRDIDF